MNIQILTYSDRAVCVLGQTKPIKDKLKELNGKFNTHLRHPETGERCIGWIFSKRHESELKRLFITPVVLGGEPVAIEPAKIIQDEPKQPEPTPTAPAPKKIAPKQKKQAKTAVKPILVKVSGFMEMERTFIKESEMMKFLKQIRDSYQDAVLNKVSYSDLYHAGGYTNKSVTFWEMYNENIAAIKKAGIEPLKIEFKQL